MRLVIRIGGSVVASPLNADLISDYVEKLKLLRHEGHEVVTVVGGGSLARELIQVSKKLGLSETEQDEIAISASRLIAQLFTNKLGKLGCGFVPKTVEEAVECLEKGKIVVMGGLKPGMTTDTVAALIIEKTHAELLIKATDQEGVYTKDPKKHPDAKKIDHLTYDELPKLLEQNSHKAGIHQILDPKAVQKLREIGVKTVIVNGHNPTNLLLAVKGEKIGTVIEH